MREDRGSKGRAGEVMGEADRVKDDPKLEEEMVFLRRSRVARRLLPDRKVRGRRRKEERKQMARREEMEGEEQRQRKNERNRKKNFPAKIKRTQSR